MTTQSRFFYGYVILGICFLITMAIMGMVTSFGIFFTPLIEEMGWSRTATSAAFSLNAIMAGIFGIIGGFVNDRLGPRVVLPILCIITAAGYYLVSQMNTVWQFYLFFGLIVGLGSNVYVPAMSTVARWFTGRRSLMSGIAFSGSGFGLVILPLFINWIIGAYDWRFSLVIISIIIMVISILAIIFLKADPYKIGLVPYGSDTAANENRHTDVASLTLRDAIRTKPFWLLVLSLFCYGFCFVAFQAHLAVHSNDVGISATGAALILTVMGAATIVGQIGIGGIGDKVGYKRAYIAGLFCIILAVLTILFARDLWLFIVFASLLGLAFGNCSTQESPLVAWLFGLSSHGTLLGVAAFSWTFGGSVGPLIFGAIYDAQGDYRYAFWVAGIISIIAVILSFFLKRAVKDSPSR